MTQSPLKITDRLPLGLRSAALRMDCVCFLVSCLIPVLVEGVMSGSSEETPELVATGSMLLPLTGSSLIVSTTAAAAFKSSSIKGGSFRSSPSLIDEVGSVELGDALV